MLLDRNPIGLVVRSFAAKPEQVAGQVKAVRETVDIALALTVSGKHAIKRIDVMVPTDQRFGDSDCGLTATALCAELNGMQKQGVYVSEIGHGDLYCCLLNKAIFHQGRAGCDYSIILSTGARSYLNEATLATMIEAAEAGALCIPVMLNELAESIALGCPANTLCMWHLESLSTVGSFDLLAAKPMKDGWPAVEKRGWAKPESQDITSGEYRYHLAGVEEIIPAVNMYVVFGRPIIAPIFPQGESMKQWLAPDADKDPAGYTRHKNKMMLKEVRQQKMADHRNVDLSFLMGAVMPAYRRF